MKAQQLKNAILQLAIQGKLVLQDPNDEPASVLLEKIKQEKARLIAEGKIKKSKKSSLSHPQLLGISKGKSCCETEGALSEGVIHIKKERNKPKYEF